MRVRGLRASIPASRIRLNPIAAERAATIATTIQKTRLPVIPPARAARAAEASAKGRAKTECEKRIIRP